LGRREARRIATPIARKIVRSSESGFALIEVLVAIAIVGILAIIAVPQYLDFTRRATFTELIQAAAPIRQSVELAVQTRGVTDIETLDSGALGIPATVAAAVAAHGSTVADGVITMTWRNDGTNLDAVTYTLTPNGVVPPIDWTVGGTCLAQNVC
jgi:type IV pilus assembly protein PilA